MSTNLLAIYKQLFLKNPKDIKDIFINVTAFVEDKDRAIADFLSVEYPELIWLIRVLQVEYEKQNFSNMQTQQQIVENIARSITLTVDETGTLDYGQNDHNNIIYNTIETHLTSPQYAILHNSQEQDDIISLEGSNPDMNLVYQKDTTFNDIVQHLVHPTTINNETVFLNLQCFNTTKTQQTTTHAQSPDAFINNHHNNSLSNTSITLTTDHVTITHASDEMDVAQVVD